MHIEENPLEIQEIKPDEQIDDSSSKKIHQYSDNMVLREQNKNCRWYILRAFTNQEQRAVNEFTMKLHNLGKIDALVEIFTPKEQVVLIKNNKKVAKEENFYHGYIFVCIDNTDQTVLNDVAHMLLTRNTQLQIVPQAEIDTIKLLAQEKMDKPRTSLHIDIGHTVKVVEGPYSDMKGVVDKIDAEHSKLIVKLAIFGRETPVELNLHQVVSED